MDATSDLLDLFRDYKDGRFLLPARARSTSPEIYFCDETAARLRPRFRRLRALGSISDDLTEEEHRSLEADWQAINLYLFGIDQWLFFWGFTTNWAVQLASLLGTEWTIRHPGFRDFRRPSPQPYRILFDKYLEVVIELGYREEAWLLRKWDTICAEEGVGAQQRMETAAARTRQDAQWAMEQAHMGRSMRQIENPRDAEAENDRVYPSASISTQAIEGNGFEGSLGTRATRGDHDSNASAELTAVHGTDERADADHDGAQWDSNELAAVYEEPNKAEKLQELVNSPVDMQPPAFRILLGQVLPPRAAPTSEEPRTTTVGREWTKVTPHGTMTTTLGDSTMTVGAHKGYKVRGRKHQLPTVKNTRRV